MHETQSWFAGVDWASQKHDVWLTDASGKRLGKRTFAHNGEGLAQMCDWLVANNLGDCPLHFTRFTPLYKLVRLPVTPVETLDRARETARKAGMKYVYIGNVPGHAAESTFCARCGSRIGLSFEPFPGFVGICGGTFDDPHWFKPDRHIFTQTAVPWMVFPPDVACYRQHAIRLDGTPEDPWQEPVPS